MLTRFFKAHRYTLQIQELGQLPFHCSDPFNLHHCSVQIRTTITAFSDQMNRVQRDQIKSFKVKTNKSPGWNAARRASFK